MTQAWMIFKDALKIEKNGEYSRDGELGPYGQG